MQMESARDARRKRPRSPCASSEADQTAPRPASKRCCGGGIYVPPHRAAAAAADDESRDAYDWYGRRSWDALRKSITGLVNKATAANVRHVAPELLAEHHLMRGRGLLCRALLRSQAACPALTDVFAALAAAVNAKLPFAGRLLLVRLALRVRRALAHGDKAQLSTASRFVAHLVNQGVAHELLALELATALLDEPTPCSIEVAVGLVRECGAALTESCPRGVDAVFECLRRILRDGGDGVDKRVQFMIEDLFAVRRARFRDHPRVRPELDLIAPEDQVTHQVELSLTDNGAGHVLDPKLHLDVFVPTPFFEEDDKAYEEHKRAMFGDDDDAESGDEKEAEEPDVVVNDETNTDLTNLRRTIYLTLMSSVDSEEAGHKLLSVVRPGEESELCDMLTECCRKEKAHCAGFYGRLARRLCAAGGRAYGAGVAACFARHYAMAHLMQTDELRAAAGLFARLLAANDGEGEGNAVPWRAALGRVRVTEEDTTSSSRIFLKVLFQDLAEQLGVRELSRRMNDEDAEVRDALFPSDSAGNTRFAINYFTAIGLGGVTESARQLLLLSAQ